MDNLHASAIFCDDIREELRDKYSYIGVYASADILVPAIPFTLPRICVVASLVAKEIISDLELHLEYGDVHRRIEISSDEQTTIEYPSAEEDFSRSELIVNTIMSPFHIVSEGTLEVYFLIGEQRVFAGMINIKHASEDIE